MNKGLLVLISVSLVAIVVAISGCTDSNSNSNNIPINVSNFTVTADSYGMWNVDGEITPKKDMSYLEMVTIWYDSTGAVIYRDSLAWNINDAKAGQALKVHSSTSLYQKGTPSKVDLLFFDSAFSGGNDSNAIYNETRTL